MKRRPSLELLDTDTGTRQEVEATLRDLRWFNRKFGGIDTSRKLIETVADQTGCREFSVLEVAAGEGYVPEQVANDVAQSGIRLRTTLLDRAPSHLPKNGTMSRLAADALSLPFTDSSFDIVSCSLFAHHLSPEQLAVFARESLRVCCVAVLVNDLVRHPLHLAMAYAGIPFYNSRLTRNDAPASVWQAYTAQEMETAWRTAGARHVDVSRHYFFRMGVIAWKRVRDAV
jgi:ubiquinone/menaquinone biosynthesis C-methylase UbiE